MVSCYLGVRRPSKTVWNTLRRLNELVHDKR